ncbi:MAG: cobalt ECF transporter T component CbiQ [Oscillospiraceae bacterium]|nr:cobalt ECF transporter T component CbiQ [Oscillospiraceae bacterium]
MNKMEKALYELTEMDDLAARSSPIHGLCPMAKLLSTIAYIAVVVSFHKYELSALVPMLLWPVLLFQLSGIPVRTCFYKLRIVLPLVMAVGLFNPFFDRAPMLALGGVAVSGGVVSMLTLMLKGVLCLMASFLLMATTPIDHLCAALRRLHVPGMLVTLLLLTYRYVGVMTEELAVMTEAYHLRAPGQKGIHVSAWGSFLGQLLLRSMDRAEELYNSMQLRGYHEHFHYADIKPCTPRDAVYTLCCIALFLLLRLVDAASLLGGLFVR